MPSFSSKKQLKFVITLGEGSFKKIAVSLVTSSGVRSGGKDQITLQGFRATANIQKAGGVQMGQLQAKIYGVKQSDMQAITCFQWKPLETVSHHVDVYAVDGDAQYLVFSGTIVNAWGDYQSAPDVFLYIKAATAYQQQITPANATSYQGAIDAAVALRQIAEAMGLQFENNGAKAMMNDIYLANTLTEQAKEIAKAANFGLYIDDKVMAITPQYGARAGIIPEISPQSGMVGYPTFDGLGITVQMLFNPAVLFGGQMKVVTDVQQAAGIWNVASVSHVLESEKPNGQWFTVARGILGDTAIIR